MKYVGALVGMISKNDKLVKQLNITRTGKCLIQKKVYLCPKLRGVDAFEFMYLPFKNQ